MSFDINNAALFAFMARRRDIEDTNSIMITAGLAKGDALTKTIIPMTVVNQAEEIVQKNREIAALRKTQVRQVTAAEGNGTTATGTPVATQPLTEIERVEAAVGALAADLLTLTKTLTELLNIQKKALDTTNTPVTPVTPPPSPQPAPNN
jgi:hypothetical protein